MEDYFSVCFNFKFFVFMLLKTVFIILTFFFFTINIEELCVFNVFWALTNIVIFSVTLVGLNTIFNFIISVDLIFVVIILTFVLAKFIFTSALIKAVFIFRFFIFKFATLLVVVLISFIITNILIFK